MTNLVLGLDGGGSKTELAVADDRGEVVAFERDEGLDPLADAGWADRLGALLGRLGGIVPRLRWASLALPAFGEADAVTRRQVQAAACAVNGAHDVLNDVHAAQIGAFAGGSGTLLLAGTGAMVWSQDKAGRCLRVGGWGEAFGDEGSAFWVGREALGMVTRTLDGRAGHGAFSRALLQRLGLARDDLLGWCWSLGNRRAGIASVARVVDELADAGDADAEALLLAAANHLVDHVETARAASDLSDPLPWSFAGGLFNSATVSLRVTSRLGAPTPPILTPVGGALFQAARKAGWRMDQGWEARVAATLNGAVTQTRH